MRKHNFAAIIVQDLTPVWDISEILLDWGLKIKFGYTENILNWPEFTNIIRHNKTNGTLDNLLAFPSSFYSWPDRSIFINLSDYAEKRNRGYNAPVHEFGHACHHLLRDKYPSLDSTIAAFYAARKKTNRFIDPYSYVSPEEFFAQSFAHFHNTKFSLHPAVKTKWELKIFDHELFKLISLLLRNIKFDLCLPKAE